MFRGRRVMAGIKLRHGWWWLLFRRVKGRVRWVCMCGHTEQSTQSINSASSREGHWRRKTGCASVRYQLLCRHYISVDSHKRTPNSSCVANESTPFHGIFSIARIAFGICSYKHVQSMYNRKATRSQKNLTCRCCDAEVHTGTGKVS